MAVNAVVFDGSNDYLSRGASLGMSDGKKGLLAFWLKMNGGDGVTQRLFGDNQGRLIVQRTNLNVIQILVYDTGGTLALSMRTSSTVTASSGWVHFLASWDMAVARQIYLNDASDSVLSTFVNTDLDYTDTDYGIGATPGGGSKMNASLAEFYWDPAVRLDLSVAANRRNFITAALEAKADLSTSNGGGWAGGSQPVVYLNNAAASFGGNDGTGGNFTVNGSLDDDASPPPTEASGLTDAEKAIAAMAVMAANPRLARPGMVAY